MQQAGAPFWPPCSLRRGGAACVAIEKERGAWEVGRFHPDKQNWCQKQKKKQQRLHFFRGKKQQRPRRNGSSMHYEVAAR
jgi:hypothetical protein